jgi:hypothetical protein
MKQKPITRLKRIRAVLEFYLERGINKESVNRVYYNVLNWK